ncbi:MAG TPA: hypothetical protein VFQ53_09725 [Kofleriaceae bacterium]|nr:hypothetical protein [Kofleriaceae bacterium]
MKKTILAAVFAFALSASAGSAQAGGQEGTIGVGAEFGLAGSFDPGFGLLGGASGNYDAGKFHVGGFLGFADPAGDDNTVYTFGARFYYHLHSTAMSDFGVGGQIGLLSVPDAVDPNEKDTLVFIEPGVQLRAFIASNVALSFSVGIVIGAGDADGTFFGGQTTGAAGVHYYFF